MLAKPYLLSTASVQRIQQPWLTDSTIYNNRAVHTWGHLCYLPLILIHIHYIHILFGKFLLPDDTNFLRASFFIYNVDRTINRFSYGEFRIEGQQCFSNTSHAVAEKSITLRYTRGALSLTQGDLAYDHQCFSKAWLKLGW